MGGGREEWLHRIGKSSESRCRKKWVKGHRVDQDEENHFSHFPVLRYQGEALHYFGEGAYKVFLNTRVYIALHVILLIIKKNAGRNRRLCTPELWHAMSAGHLGLLGLLHARHRSVAGYHDHRLWLYRLLFLNRTCSVNNNGKLWTQSIWTSDKQFSYAPKHKYLAKTSGACFIFQKMSFNF